MAMLEFILSHRLSWSFHSCKPKTRRKKGMWMWKGSVKDSGTCKKIHGLAFRKTHITKFPEASGKTKIHDSMRIHTQNMGLDPWRMLFSRALLLTSASSGPWWFVWFFSVVVVFWGGGGCLERISSFRIQDHSACFLSHILFLWLSDSLPKQIN